MADSGTCPHAVEYLRRLPAAPPGRVAEPGACWYVFSVVQRAFTTVARRALRRAAVAALTWTVALVVLVGVMRAGSSFVYCHVMDSVRADCCCEHTNDAAADGPAIDMGCCDARTVGALPTAAVASPCELPSAPLLAVLAPQWANPLSNPPSIPRSAIADRFTARPPPTAAASCARLSVFLI